MVIFLEIIVLILLFVLGIVIAKHIKTTSLYLDVFLIVLIIISPWIGRDTNLLSIFDFKLLLPSVLQAISAGVLARHFILNRFVRLKSR